VLTAITTWCHHNGAREAFMQLFPAVRLEYLQPHELHAMSQHALVLENPVALAQVQAALSAAYSTDSPPRNAEQRRQRRAPPNLPDSGSPTIASELKNRVASSWLELS
jgi:hypothetical protein